jgi:OCT family organic cation transporter-like MFS transporter 4/5
LLPPNCAASGIIAPFIALAGAATNSGLVPFLTFGASCLLGGLLIFTLPETLGTPLPDTMADMGVIASIFTNGTLKKGLKAAAASMFKVRVKLPGRGASRWSRLMSGGAGKAAGGGNRPGKQCSVWTEDEVGIVEEEAGAREGVEALIIATHRTAAPAGSSAAALQAGAGAGSGSGGGGGSTRAPAARA